MVQEMIQEAFRWKVRDGAEDAQQILIDIKEGQLQR